jgi:hypothetical protein
MKGNKMSTYAWIITRDFISDDTPYERWGKDSVPVNISGPHGATPEQIAKAASGGAPFKIYDDDGIKYYEGRFWADDGSGSNSGDAFGPLDDYGTPNAGAVTIKYRNPGTRIWETL